MKTVRDNLNKFVSSNKDILIGKKMSGMVFHSSKQRKMTFLHRDIVFKELPKYAKTPIAKELINGALEKIDEILKTGMAFSGDLEEEIKKDPRKRDAYVLRKVADLKR